MSKILIGKWQYSSASLSSPRVCYHYFLSTQLKMQTERNRLLLPVRAGRFQFHCSINAITLTTGEYNATMTIKKKKRINQLQIISFFFSFFKSTEGTWQQPFSLKKSDRERESERERERERSSRKLSPHFVLIFFLFISSSSFTVLMLWLEFPHENIYNNKSSRRWPIHSPRDPDLANYNVT